MEAGQIGSPTLCPTATDCSEATWCSAEVSRRKASRAEVCANPPSSTGKRTDQLGKEEKKKRNAGILCSAFPQKTQGTLSAGKSLSPNHPWHLIQRKMCGPPDCSTCQLASRGTHKFTQQQEKDVPTLTTWPPGKRPLAALLLPLPKSHFFTNMQVRQHKEHKMLWPGSTDKITGLHLNTEVNLFFFYNSK